MTDLSPIRLPRGRHGLTREEVATDQRRRMIDALAEEMAARGYAGTSVADILRSAGVSRETFYQQFRSKLDCFLAAFDVAADELFAPIRAQLEPLAGAPATFGPADRLEAFDELFGAYLRGITERPAHARVFLVEVYAAGPEAMARRMALQAQITDSVALLLGAGDERGRFACKALVAAVSALVTPHLVADDLPGILALREPIVDLAARSLLA